LEAFGTFISVYRESTFTLSVIEKKYHRSNA